MTVNETHVNGKQLLEVVSADNSHGCGGLTAEFYQTFFDLIGSNLVDAIMHLKMKTN